MKPLDPGDWLKIIRPGSRVFIGSGASVPQALVNQMLLQPEGLRDVEVMHIHTLGPTPWINPEYDGKLRTNTFFLTPEVAQAVREGRADYTPCSMSEVPRLIKSSTLPVDVALVMVSPADASGRFSLGVSVDVTLSAVRSARKVVAQINRQMPRTLGPASLASQEIDYFIEVDAPLPELPMDLDDPVRARIAAYVAELVEDGSTLQVGIGRTTQASLRALTNHRHLGIHTGMFSDGMMELIRSGAVDNSRKHFQADVSIASHVLGSQALYQFVSENSEISFHPSEWVNDPGIISLNHRMVAINGARQIDLTGQVVRDSRGDAFHGGVGAQLDFLRGAAASQGGRPIHVLPSTTTDGSRSRIVAGLAAGAGVATSRTDVAHVVTEHGIATLRGRSIRERSMELIQIAHPKFREELLKGAHARGWLPKFITSVPLSPQEPSAVDKSTPLIASKRFTLGPQSDRFLLRPLHPIDMRRLQDFFYSHDEDTVRMRYGYLRADMPAESAYRLVSVDQQADVALGIFSESVSRTEPALCAVARYYRDPEAQTAEMAFVVGETYRRMGMASTLITELATIADQQGIAHLRAEVLRINLPMKKLFEKFGGQSKASKEVDGSTFMLEPKVILEHASKQQQERASQPARPARVATGWHWSEGYLDHDTGPAHPENAERYQVLGDGLKSAAESIDAVRLFGREATRRELLRCHAAHYLDLVHIDCESLADHLRTGDTAISPESERVAKQAAGAALDAVDRVMSGDLLRAFVAVRPPGHHATPERGMGFCIFNHVALMARHAQEEHGCKKVLIVDWDVHHGNGTQDCFYADPSVFFFSTHQANLYPHTGSAENTGAGPGAGTVMNVPLPAGSGIHELLPAFKRLTSAMNDFQPNLVLISAGFDAHIDDPIGGLALRDEDFATLTKLVIKIANRWAGGKIVSVLEGGYNPQALARSAIAHFLALSQES